MDEPTNHLDIEAKEVLEKALKDFDGTLLFVSHDRYFINQLANKIVSVRDGHAKIYNGNYSYYLDEKAKQEAAVFTYESMRKRSFILVSNCCLCWEAVDTVGQRFLHYKTTDHLWKQLKQQLIWEKASNIGKSPPNLNKSFSFSLSILSKKIFF